MADQPANPSSQRQRIAVVGAGAAGISSAWLLSRRHEVVLFEKAPRIGGHTNTIAIPDGPDAGTPVDTGFIVLNDRTYPVLEELFRQWGVETRDSDMSFGFHCEETGLQYAGTSLDGLFAQRANLASPRFWHLCAGVLRFQRTARRDLEQGAIDPGTTLGRYLSILRLPANVVHDYILPMGAAIWSTPGAEMLRFPALSFLRFFSNHGLLTVTDMPQWKTVVGGSHAYLQRFRELFAGRIVEDAGIAGVRRSPRPAIRFRDGADQEFDHIVLAAHADESLALLDDPSDAERALLGAWEYNRNTAILHTDESAMPPNRRAWASWNYTREVDDSGATNLSLTYDMNRLQGLETQRRYFVSLNRRRPPDKSRIVRTIKYTHPKYSVAAIESQGRLAEIDGVRGTWYAGSYRGYGFHEDAVKSGLAVAKAFGIEL